MKSNFNKKVAGLLALTTVSLSPAVQAVTETTISITATVKAIFSVEPINAVTLNENHQSENITIKTHTNATSAKITIKSDNGEDDHFNLTKGNDRYQLKASISGDGNAKFDKASHQMETTVVGIGDQKTTLHLEDNNGGKELPAGEYKGTLTVTVGAA